MLKENLLNELMEVFKNTEKNYEVLQAIEIIRKHDDEEIRKLLSFDEEYRREIIRFLNICYESKLILKIIDKNELFKYIQGISDYTIASDEMQLLEAYKNIANYFEFVGVKTICSEYYSVINEIFEILESLVLKYKSFDNVVINNVLNYIDEKSINIIEESKKDAIEGIKLYKDLRYYMLYDYCIRAYLMDVINSKKYFGDIPQLSDCINTIAYLKIEISQEDKVDLIRSIFKINNLNKKLQKINDQLRPEIDGSNQSLNLI
ncbi:MAG: hypothetical protein J6B98_05545 [Bacilli bacterium]|nr:hypothetical protein [Bacilli bacterium]